MRKTEARWFRGEGPLSKFFEPLERRELLSASFDLIGLTDLRDDPAFAGIDGSDVGVVIIDTGLDTNHPIIRDNYVDGADLVSGANRPTVTGDHGTHVAGIAAASDPQIGTAIDANLFALQVFTDVPGQGLRAFNHHIEASLQWVLEHREEHNLQVVNLSLGAGFYTSPNQATSVYSDEIRQLEAAGVTVVAAAGNSYPLNMSPNSGSPGIEATLNVGAVWETSELEGAVFQSGVFDQTTGPDRIAGFSQRPPLQDNALFAPGAAILSALPGGRDGELAGTSMASPMVAGAVALVQETAMAFGGRYLSPDEVADLLISTADTVFDGDDEDSALTSGEPFVYTNQAYPRLNIYNAVQTLRDQFDAIAPPPDPEEPQQGADVNGTIAGAILGPSLSGAPTPGMDLSIGFDGAQTQIGDQDVDMVRFEVLTPGRVSITTETLQAAPSDFDTMLRLFDPQGQQLAANDDDPNRPGTLFSGLEVDLQPGVYYVGVSGYNNASYDPNQPGRGVSGQTGNYHLSFSLSSPDANGTFIGAVDVNLGSSTEPELFNGLIGFDYGDPVGLADVDLFRLTAPEDGQLLIDIDTPFDQGDYVDSFLRVFDEQGNELAFSDDNLSQDTQGNPTEFIDPLFPGLVFEHPTDREFFQGHVTDSFAFGGVQAGQTYYIGVSDFANQVYDPQSLENRNPNGTGGSYNLKITFVNGDLNGSIPDAVDLRDQPLPIVDQPGIIGNDFGQDVGQTDIDFLRLTAPRAGVYEITVDSTNDPSIDDPVDSVLYVFDAQGNVLAGNDDANQLDPAVRMEVVAGQDLFVAVTGFGNDRFDPFQLGSGTPGDTGSYTFSARMLQDSEVRALIDDRTTFSPGSLTEDQPINGFLGGDNGLVLEGDVDLYYYRPSASGMVTVRTLAPDAFAADTVLRLFNEQGDELAYNDDASENTLMSQIAYEVLADQRYIVGVSGFGPNARSYHPVTGGGADDGSEGGYGLSASLEASQPPEVQMSLEGPGAIEATEAQAAADGPVLRFSRSGPTDEPLEVRFSLGGSATAGQDYETPTLSLMIPAGETSRTLPLVVLDDQSPEGDEQIVFTLSASEDYGIAGPANATFTILDDDEADAGGSLDVDGDGDAEVGSDGVLVLRYLFGFVGPALTDGAVTGAEPRSEASEILAYLDQHRQTMLDIDGDGDAEVGSDGVVLLRYLFGFTGNALIDGALSGDEPRSEPAQIIAFLDGFNPALTNAAQEAYTHPSSQAAGTQAGSTDEGLTEASPDSAGLSTRLAHQAMAWERQRLRLVEAQPRQSAIGGFIDSRTEPRWKLSLVEPVTRDEDRRFDYP